MKKETAIETDYSKAWRAYILTTEYMRLQNLLTGKGIGEPYATSILHDAFDAGWNARSEYPRP